MNKISGKVVVKESGFGIPDLLVVIFDVDLNTEPEESTTRVTFASSSRTSTAIGFEQGFPGDRLGSVLTDQNGAFELSYEDEEFQVRNPEEKRPDLFLLVLAPEEVGEDLNSRILFTSTSILQNAGRNEQILIRLTTEQLEEADVPIPTEPGAISEEPNDVIRRLTKAEADQSRLFTGLRSINKRRITRVRKQTQTFKEKLQPKLLQLLTNVPEKAVDSVSDTYIAPDQSVTEKSHQRMKHNIKEVINATDPKVRPPIIGRIYLSPEQLEGLQEFADENGDLVNVPDVIIEPMMGRSAIPNEQPTDFLANNPISRLCREATTGEKCLDRDIDVDKEDDKDEEVPIEEEEEIVVEVVGLGIEATTAEDIPRYIARLIDQITAPEEPVSFGEVTAGKRANEEDIQRRIEALSFRRGPADVPAFYDFHNLQIAFEHVWQEAIDLGILDMAEDAYQEIVQLGGDPCTQPRKGVSGAALDLIACFRREFSYLQQAVLQDPPITVLTQFDITREQWSVLNDEMQDKLIRLATNLQVIDTANLIIGSQNKRTRLRQQGERILKYTEEILAHRNDPFNHLHQILGELEQRIREPYAFTVYGANRHERSVNFGILITYRQKWEPVTYQVGELVKTITLAPKEVRKFSKKTVVKRSRAQKEMENSLASRREESTATSRVEAEIVRNAEAKTNFSLTAQGSYNVGISEGTQTTTFGENAGKTSNEVKKEFREAVFKAAQEYKDERKIEVSTEESFEEEFMESGEIMNPNDELPVTFLFYELQRRYKVSERIHRLQPVVLVAQEVPAPHEIDEEWLIAHDWILRRFLLDDSFLPALNYLSTRVVGDEFALKEMRKNVEQQRKLVEELKEEVVAYRELSGDRYSALERAIERSALAAEEESDGGLFGAIGDLVAPGARFVEKQLDFLGGDDSDGSEAARIRERAARDAYEKAAQDEREWMARLNREITALNAMTETYTTTLSEHLNRKTQIARLRFHVKQNILYYMQGIWLMEPPDQRYFRLHKVQVPIFEKKGNATYNIRGQQTYKGFINPGKLHFRTFEYAVHTEIDPEFETADLVEVADLDNLLGFKGNYMMFRLKKSNPLTEYMMAPYLDQEWGLYDPDVAGNMTLDEFSGYVCCLKEQLPPEEFEAAKPELKELLEELLTSPLRNEEQVILPSNDSLYIEALPGVHPILEDFKLIHRAIDVKKEQEVARRDGLKNLWLAARLLAGELEDPEIEAKYVFEGNGTATVLPPSPGSNP